jgi:predicted nucleic-acid-binding protein
MEAGGAPSQMTGVDTNVLVRFFAVDDETQMQRVDRFLQASRAAGERVFVSALVLCETCWVLRSSYAKSKGAVLDAVETLLNADVFNLEEPDAMRRALQLARAGKADFPDYLVGELHLSKGCRYTVTFDRSLRGDAAFLLL